jgi:D-glycero-D-manno-heptose 1,7-bisphosphate phosphatase
VIISKSNDFESAMKQNAALFFDRDGVINKVINSENFRGPRCVEEVFISEGILEILSLSKFLGFSNLVVTNQPDVSRGHLSVESLQSIHNLVMHHLPNIDAIITCPHASSDWCICRKPKDGMLRVAGQEFNIDLSRSFMIGDRWVDIEAGRSAGVKTVLVEREYSWLSTSSGVPPAELIPDFVISHTDRLKDLFTEIFGGEKE